VVFSREPVTHRHEVVYDDVVGEIAYDSMARIVELRFRHIPDDHAKTGLSNDEDVPDERVALATRKAI
jgi:hypothetical protein